MKILTKGTLKLFDWFLITGAVTFNIIYSTLSGEFDIIGSIASVTGVVCVVLVAKRSISNYIFGIINVSLYACISYKSRLYGDFALNAFYYLPMQFIGWAMWVKKKGDLNSKGQMDQSIVKSRIMKWRKRLLLVLACAATIFLTGFLLQCYTADPQPYKDSATTVLSIIAMFLMVRQYTEQWILWAIVNIISILMWMFLWISDGSHAGLMVIMYVFYLANSINGLVVWNNAAIKDTGLKV